MKKSKHQLYVKSKFYKKRGATFFNDVTRKKNEKWIVGPLGQAICILSRLFDRSNSYPPDFSPIFAKDFLPFIV